TLHIHSFPTRRSSDLFEVLTKHDSLCLSSKSFTIINNSKKLSSSISIFDSMIDYLSAIKLGWLTSSVQNILILNSHLPTNEVIRSEEHTSELQSRFDL